MIKLLCSYTYFYTLHKIVFFLIEDLNINWVTHEGETPLLLACKRRDRSDAIAVVAMLLEHGADPNIKDNEEDTPLLAGLLYNLHFYSLNQLLDSSSS